MIRIGWFSPISSETGIASYSAQVLSAMHAQFSRDDLEVVVFHPPISNGRVDMPYPTIALSDELLQSDFFALFDVAIYHLGNNSLNHAPIYKALMRHPGVVVLHDHVYQHYLAGVTIAHGHSGPSYATLLQNAAPDGFRVLKSSGAMRGASGPYSFLPWESEWATKVPLGDRFVNLGLGTIVHSDYARRGLGERCGAGSEVKTLFMPSPEIETPDWRGAEDGRLRIACCGHIGSTKGIGELLDAFARSSELRSSFRVTIAGFDSDPTYFEWLLTTIQDAGLHGVFEVKVGLTDEEFHKVLGTSDIFYNLRCPNTEGASLSLMEQLAHGSPVIAYRTGCFAEFPDEAFYFLDNVGDHQTLIDLLLHIAANRDEIPKKGEAARIAVQGKSAAAYARQFVDHVREHLPAFRRRSALVHTRAQGWLPQLGDDREWLSALIESRKEMQKFYAGSLLLPETFGQMPRKLKGAFLTANILGANVDAKTDEKIGGGLELLTVVQLVNVFGTFATVASLGDESDFLEKDLHPAALPVTDLRFWRILDLLPAKNAALLALSALGCQAKSEFHGALCEEIGKIGFKKAVLNYIGQDNGPRTIMIEASPLGAFLLSCSDADMERLQVAPLAKNLVSKRTVKTKGPLFLPQGFHALDQGGIWGYTLQSALYIRNGMDRSLTHVVGVVAKLVPNDTDGGTITITVEELGSGRSETTQVICSNASLQATEWSLPLPCFKGNLRVLFETPSLWSPAELDISVDSRKLGVWVKALTLHNDDAPFEESTSETRVLPESAESVLAVDENVLGEKKS